MNEDENNSKTIVVSKSTIIISILVFILLIIIAIFSYKKFNKDFVEFIINTSIGLITLIIAFFGVNILKNYPIKDNPYYPYHYSKSEINKIIKKYNKDNKEYSDKIYPFIKQLMDDDKYFEKIDFLQNTSLDFIKIWNDFNYYNSRPSKENKEYLFKIQKTINSMIYEKVHNNS